MSKTGIICTTGPSTDNATVLNALIDAGMNMARMNFSHGEHSEHRNRIDMIRALNDEREQNVYILQDLEGFRVRVGTMPPERNGEIELRVGQTVRLTNHEVENDPNAIPLDYHGSLDVLRVGNLIHIDDGSISLEAKSVRDDSVSCQVIVAGTVKEHKGVNIPDANFPFTGLTGKDQTDILFGIENRVDYIAQSFVRSGQDIVDLKDFISDHDFNCKLIAKIENREGIRNLADILDVVDGIMVARGDLGVSLPIHEVPILQKILIKECKKRDRFVITATQMMESMTTSMKPTRADVSDVANAVLDGTDYVMLSGETAIGRYPVHVVRMMREVISFAESFPSLDYFTK